MYGGAKTAGGPRGAKGRAPSTPQPEVLTPVRGATAAAGTGFAPDARSLHALLDHLLGAYGPQHWWPGDSPFEVMVGAVLTQNTAWSNVERAIANLKAAGAAVTRVDRGAVPANGWRRSSGPPAISTSRRRRLQAFCRFLLEAGGEPALRRPADRMLRARLLAVHGVGPETADDILLYAFERPVFVIDAYTRRLFGGSAWSGHESYEELRAGVRECHRSGCGRVQRAARPDRPPREGRVYKAPRCTGCCLR